MVRTVACVLVAAFGASACAAHDKAGGAAVTGPRTVEITMPDGSPYHLTAYASALARDPVAPTRATFRTGWRSDDAEADAETIGDVRAGRLGFAVVSARGLDTVGVDALEPLLAPLAIDSLEAERRVLASDLPSRLLPALTKLGVVGVALLPGELRHPLGITRSLVHPEDFAGLTIGIRSSELARRAFEQLGASVALNRGKTYRGVDGIEADLTVIEADEADRGAVALAADLTLWPRVLVLVANPGVWNRLGPERRKAMRDAARRSLPVAIKLLRERDAEAYGVLCRRADVTLVPTTTDDAVRLREALTPVTDGLDPSIVSEIQDIRIDTGVPPRHPPCRRSSFERPGPATPLDGVWTFDSDAGDLRAVGAPPGDITPENYGHHVLAISHGRFAITQEDRAACGWVYGTVAVHGHQMIWDVINGYGRGPENAENRPGERFQYAWSRFRDTLRLSPAPPAISAENYMAKPWRRIGSDPRRAPFGRRCPLPAEAQF